MPQRIIGFLLGFWFFFFGDKILEHSPGWPRTCHPSASAFLCWDYKYVPPHLAWGLQCWQDKGNAVTVTSGGHITPRPFTVLPALSLWLPGNVEPQQPHARSSSPSALPPLVASAHAHQSHGPAWSNLLFPWEEGNSVSITIWLQSANAIQENNSLPISLRANWVITSHIAPKIFNLNFKNVHY
jgi:hypothetical protein